MKIMEPTNSYLLNWIYDITNVKYTSILQLRDGKVLSQIINCISPSTIFESAFIKNSESKYRWRNNFEMINQAFQKLEIQHNFIYDDIIEGDENQLREILIKLKEKYAQKPQKMKSTFSKMSTESELETNALKRDEDSLILTQQSYSENLNPETTKFFNIKINNLIEITLQELQEKPWQIENEIHYLKKNNYRKKDIINQIKEIIKSEESNDGEKIRMIKPFIEDLNMFNE